MIELTRLNGHPLVINAELIKFVEENPDTVITLVTGDKMVVREAAQEVMYLVVTYRRNLLQPDLAPPQPQPKAPVPGAMPSGQE